MLPTRLRNLRVLFSDTVICRVESDTQMKGSFLSIFLLLDHIVCLARNDNTEQCSVLQNNSVQLYIVT